MVGIGISLLAGLPIGCGSTMFAEVVSVQECLGYAGGVGLQGQGPVCHPGYGLKNNGVVSGIVRGLAPAKGRVTGDEHGGNCKRVDSSEAFDDGKTGFMHVAPTDCLVGEGCGNGHGAVEVVGVGGAECGNGHASLGEAGRELGVSMDDGTDGGELAIEKGVGVEIGGGFEVSIDDLAVEIGDDHMFGTEVVVVDAGGLDDDQTLLAIDAAGVAKGIEDQAAFYEFKISFEDGGAQILQQHGRSPFSQRLNLL